MTNEHELRQRFSLLSEKSVRRKWSCPDTQRLAAYAERRLGEPAHERLEAHLADLGYAHWEESNNPAYAMFPS